MANLSNLNNKFLVTTGGDVGINSTAPTTKLHVVGVIKAENTGSGAELLQLKYGSSGDAIFVKKLSSTNGIEFNGFDGTSWTNNILVIEDTGNVGINTASPTALLDVSSGTTTDVIRFGANSRWGFSRANSDSRYISFMRSQNSSGTAVWTVDGDNGKVGIGTTVPDVKLHVYSGDSGATTVGGASDELILENDTDCGLTIRSGTSSDGVISFADSGDHNIGQVYYSHGSNSMTFRTNDNTAVTIDSSQNVGIGTTSPSYKLHVSGTGGTRMSVTNTDTNWAAVQIQASGNQADYIFFKDDTEERARIVALDTNDLVFSNTDSATERMRIASSGNVGIGTDSPTYKLHIDSDDANDDVVFIHHDNAAQSSGTLLKIKTDAGDSNGYTLLDVQTNTGNALFVRGDRNVGVGTTSLGTITGNVSAITIGGTNGSVSGGVMYQFNGNNAASHYYESSNFRYQNIGNYDHTFYTSNTTQRFQINTNGWSYFNNQGTGGGIEINGTSGKYLDIYCNASLAVFSTNASDFYFNTDVGIGATNPTTKLTVQGVITAGDSTTNGVIRRQHQTFSTMKPGPSSGGSVDMMFVDHTNALDITVMAYINTSNVATGKGYLVTAYGSAVGGLSNTRFAGVISALSISYVNTGGSENYVLRVTCTYSGSTAPTISVTASGQSTSELRAAI